MSKKHNFQFSRGAGKRPNRKKPINGNPAMADCCQDAMNALSACNQAGGVPTGWGDCSAPYGCHCHYWEEPGQGGLTNTGGYGTCYCNPGPTLINNYIYCCTGGSGGQSERQGGPRPA